jgi:hypothetical protein
MILALIKKLLNIQSPSMRQYGYRYEYDYLRSDRRRGRMRIKDYVCKCGCSDFFFANKGNHKGIYCTACGKRLKWADKNEKNLIDLEDVSKNEK